MVERTRFLADEMLGTLAKWLRIMGYDTVYLKDRPDGEIAEWAEREGRVLLTRDKILAKMVGPARLHIRSDVIDEQVAQLISAYDLEFDESTTRCALCNGSLVRVSRSEVECEVPERSLGMTDEFFRCQGCSKIYWKGTHWRNILERLAGFGL